MKCVGKKYAYLGRGYIVELFGLETLGSWRPQCFQKIDATRDIMLAFIWLIV